MARTYSVINLAIPRSILEALEAKKQGEGRLGSLTAFAAEILNRYVSGALVSEELLRAKIEAELRKIIGQEVHQTGIDVKAHRPAKENRGAKHEAA